MLCSAKKLWAWYAFCFGVPGLMKNRYAVRTSCKLLVYCRHIRTKSGLHIDHYFAKNFIDFRPSRNVFSNVCINSEIFTEAKSISQCYKLVECTLFGIYP